MPQCCAVPMCSNKKGGHKFPKDKARLEQWLKAIRRDQYSPSIHSIVCKNHFSEDDYELPKDSVLEKPRPVLKKDAVPSIFTWNKALYEEPNMREKSEFKSAQNTIKKESSDMNSLDCMEVSTRCYTCLQQGRKLRPMKVHAKYLFNILCPEMFHETKDTSGYLICWECEVMADKTTRFQNKLKKANEILQLSLKGKTTIIEGLSSQKRTNVEIISIDPQISQNLPIQPQNLPIQPQNLPFHPQNLPIQPQNLPTQQQNLPFQPLKLPIQPQNLPFQPQNLPFQPQNLPFRSQNLPYQPQNLFLAQNLPIRSQNPPFIINPENILKLSLKDMLEAPSKLQSQTKIKIEVEDEESCSNDMEEASCSNDFEKVIQPTTIQRVSLDPLLVPRQDQPVSWPEIEVPPLLPTRIKNEAISQASLPTNTLLNDQTSLRGLRESVKVTAKAQNVSAKGTSLSKNEAPVKCQRKNDLLTKLLSNPPKGEELFLRQGVPNEPEGSKKNCEEDEAKLIILNREELEELRAKRRSLHSFINSQYKCEKCIDFYQSQEKIDEHNLKHHESRGNKICEICEQRFADESELNDHYKAHFIVYECIKCPYRNRKRLYISEHCRRKHEESSFYCKICFKEFKTFKERRMHIDYEHDQKRACTECDKTFANLARLKEHVLKMHRLEPVECPICKKMIKPYYLKYHLKTHNEKDDSFYCVECDTYYKTKLSYKLHLKTTLKHNTLEKLGESTKASTTEVQTITSRKKTNAQKCREYRERKKLQNTMVQNVTAERSDERSETDQLQAKKPKTNAERRKKHYEAQKLKKQANKKIPKTAKQRNKEYYYRKKKLKALNTLNHHSDALKCDHCDKYFASRESLKNHVAELGGVRYTCDICKKVSKSKKTLTTHIATVHKKIQRKYKPKICEVCGKSFTARKSLVEHLNSHLGVRPHVCEDCGATFIYSAALFTHRRLVHKVKKKSEVTT